MAGHKKISKVDLKRMKRIDSFRKVINQFGKESAIEALEIESINAGNLLSYLKFLEIFTNSTWLTQKLFEDVAEEIAELIAVGLEYTQPAPEVVEKDLKILNNIRLRYGALIAAFAIPGLEKRITEILIPEQHA
jgi:predicted phage tail protein